jgi:hypothetical protein
VAKLTTTTQITQVTLEDSVFVQSVNNSNESRINTVENAKSNNKNLSVIATWAAETSSDVMLIAGLHHN